MERYFDDDFFSGNEYRIMILDETEDRVEEHKHPIGLQDGLWGYR